MNFPINAGKFVTAEAIQKALGFVENKWPGYTNYLRGIEMSGPPMTKGIVDFPHGAYEAQLGSPLGRIFLKDSPRTAEALPLVLFHELGHHENTMLPELDVQRNARLLADEYLSPPGQGSLFDPSTHYDIAGNEAQHDLMLRGLEDALRGRTSAMELALGRRTQGLRNELRQRQFDLPFEL